MHFCGVENKPSVRLMPSFLFACFVFLFSGKLPLIFLVVLFSFVLSLLGLYSVAGILLALLFISLTELQARPTDSSTLPSSNFNGTSSLRNTTRSSARETTGLKPREKVDKVASSTKEMQPSSVNIKQATETQDDLSATDGSGLTRTILPTSINKNPCIKKIRYSFIYNQLFEIPICKKNHGCHEVVKIVNFGKGRTLAVTYNCQKQRS